MKIEVGLWIDYRKAVIVTLGEKGGTIRQVQSNMDKHVRVSSRSSQGNSAEDLQDRRFGNHLGRYYEGIISLIRGADSIWLFGPGEAKVELENCLKREELGNHIVGVDNVNRMTDIQIAAKVRNHFPRNL